MRARLLALGLLVSFGCSSDPTENTPAPTSDVKIVADAATKGAAAYDPNPFTISLATQTTVKWANIDGIAHTVTADDASFTSANIGKNGSFSHQFITPGTYGYHCSIHPSMVGTIEVTP